MSTIRRFEDVKAWQLGRELTKQVYEVTRKGAFARDFGLRDQIQRASVSITSNIAEGFERRTPKDFARFLTMAKGSAAEVRSQLYAALDLEYIDSDTFDALYDMTNDISRALAGLIRYLRSERAGRPSDETQNS